MSSPDDLARASRPPPSRKTCCASRVSSRSAASRCGCCVQAVGPRVNHYYDRAWTAADDRRSRLVVIGLKGLDRPAIERILAG